MRDPDFHSDQSGCTATHQARPQPSHPFDESVDPREYLLILNRRRGAIIGVFVLVLAGVWLYLNQTVPLYTAQSQLTLDLRKARVTDIEEVLSGLSADVSVIGTELDILRSSTLLGRVVDQLQLSGTPEFNPALREPLKPAWYSPGLAWLKGLWQLDADREKTDTISAEEQARILKLAIIRQLQAALQVEHRRQTHTIVLTFTSPNPKMAAKLANTLAELYLTDQMEAKYEATRRANSWLAERLDTMRGEVLAAEQAVKNVREQGNLIQGRGGTVLEQQIGDINAQLIQAQVKISQAEARLRVAREVIGQAGGIESLGEELDSTTIQNLRQEESNLRRMRSELGQRYGARHPEMIQIEAELFDLQGKMTEEANRFLRSLANEVEVARAAETSLQQSMRRLQNQAGDALETELELRELERQAESSRVLYQNFLTRFQETRDQGDLQRPDARIISAAEVPLAPSSPRGKRTMTLGALAGLMLGIMAAFLIEMIDRGFRTGSQVEQSTGLPVLGLVPLLDRGKGTPFEYVVNKQFSSLAEALRGIRTAVHLANIDRPPRTVMVTSSLPREGKSNLCVAMGRLAALAGTKTLVIDGDLRRPSLAKMFAGEKPEVMLEDLLKEGGDFNRALFQDPGSEMQLIFSHGKPPTVAEMLGSQRMQALLARLRDVYELIIIDTPPIMGVSDAWTLARHVDSVIFLVQWAETPRDTVQSALRQMGLLNIRPSGIVLSMVNMRRQKQYGSGGYGYYYGKYKNYYHD